jgi:succinate dehydrogenase hydrophobic anchor subunit
MNPYKNQSFLKLTVRFAAVFLVVVTILKIIISMFKNGGILGMVAEFFSAETWLPFVTVQLVMALVYGLLMAGYYKFIKK